MFYVTHDLSNKKFIKTGLAKWQYNKYMIEKLPMHRLKRG